MKTFFDMHTHAFDAISVPLDNIIARYGTALQILMAKIPWIKVDDRVKATLNYMQLGTKKILVNTQATILEAAQKNGYDNCVIASLFVDFSQVNPQFHQLDFLRYFDSCLEGSQIDGCKILMFYGVNFNNKRSIDKAVNLYKSGIISGVKIYPPISVMINDCFGFEYFFYSMEKYGIPIVTHCSDGGFIKRGESRRYANKKTNPTNYEKMLYKYPKTRMILAHAGGSDKNFRQKVFEYCRQYRNVYTDISYSLTNKKDMYNIIDSAVKNNSLHKIVFGTDYYVSMFEQLSYKKTVADFKEFVGDKLFDRIVNRNPISFLEATYEK